MSPRPLSELSPPERAVAELAIAERDGGRIPIVIGPWAAYLLEGALRQAVRAPGLPGTETARTGAEVADSLRAGMHPVAAGLAAELDAAGDALPADAAPGAVAPAYVALVTRMRELENGQAHKGAVELGPYSTFVSIGLLQMVTRLEAFGPGTPAYDVLTGFARQMQVTFPPEVADLIEAGFDPANDYE